MAANAIPYQSYTEEALLSYNTDAILYISDYPLRLSKDSPDLEPVSFIDGVAALHLYGGGFLNKLWGPYILDIVEELLQELPDIPYIVSGQQLSNDFLAEAKEHFTNWAPSLISVRDEVSLKLMEQIGIDCSYSFDDATESLVAFNKRLGLSKGPGTLIHLNTSDYTGRSGELNTVRKHLNQMQNQQAGALPVTLLQAFVDARFEVSDTSESIKKLGFTFPFSDSRIVFLPNLVMNDSTDLISPIRGNVGYSHSYHVTLLMQLAGIPCWMPANNGFYDQKQIALGIDGSFEEFLIQPKTFSHSQNRDRRDEWLVQLESEYNKIEGQPTRKLVWRLSEDHPQPWSFFYNGYPDIFTKHNFLNDELNNLKTEIEKSSLNVESTNNLKKFLHKCAKFLKF